MSDLPGKRSEGLAAIHHHRKVVHLTICEKQAVAAQGQQLGRRPLGLGQPGLRERLTNRPHSGQRHQEIALEIQMHVVQQHVVTEQAALTVLFERRRQIAEAHAATRIRCGHVSNDLLNRTVGTKPQRIEIAGPHEQRSGLRHPAQCMKARGLAEHQVGVSVVDRRGLFVGTERALEIPCRLTSPALSKATVPLVEPIAGQFVYVP